MHASCTGYESNYPARSFNTITLKWAGTSNSPVALANMIVTINRITVSTANRSELFQTILTLMALVRNENGCISSRFYLDSADNNSALLVEEWESEEDWDNHLRSRDCAVFLGAVSVLCRPASVEFKLLSYVAGIEAIAAARGVYTMER